MESKIKVGSFTNAGFVLFIDRISTSNPDPICKMSSTGLVSHRVSQLKLISKPDEVISIEKEIDELRIRKRILTDDLKTVEETLQNRNSILNSFNPTV